MASKHYEKELIIEAIDKDRNVSITISSVGAEPSKVAASWNIGGKSGIAFGGFQDRKYFDFQTAACAAIENAVSLARAI